MMKHSIDLAYIVGVALGDGNLSSPNGRAIRLRITCDNSYPNIVQEITHSLTTLFPDNKVSLVARKENCTDVSVYSNKLNICIPWQVHGGSKEKQHAHVPVWIFEKRSYMKAW